MNPLQRQAKDTRVALEKLRRDYYPRSRMMPLNTAISDILGELLLNNWSINQDQLSVLYHMLAEIVEEVARVDYSGKTDVREVVSLLQDMSHRAGAYREPEHCTPAGPCLSPATPGSLPPVTVAKDTPLGGRLYRSVAVEAECDPRSVQRYCAGTPVRPVVGARITKALRAVGREDLIR